MGDCAVNKLPADKSATADCEYWQAMKEPLIAAVLAAQEAQK